MAAVAYQYYTWIDQEQNNKMYAYLSCMSPTPDSDKERNEPLTIIQFLQNCSVDGHVEHLILQSCHRERYEKPPI